MKCTIDSDLPKTVFSCAEQLGDGKIQLQDRQGKLYLVHIQDILDDWCARTAKDGLVDVQIVVADAEKAKDNKIEAVKIVRNTLNMPLKDAKDFVEGAFRRFYMDQIESLRPQLLSLGYTVDVCTNS